MGGKVDAIPGKANRIVLTADAPGAYAGQCAEFCGDLHAHMGFIAYAHGPAQLEAALRAAATAP